MNKFQFALNMLIITILFVIIGLIRDLNNRVGRIQSEVFDTYSAVTGFFMTGQIGEAVGKSDDKQ